MAECFAASGTKGFRTGGTIHFVINNQIGFTTAPIYSRSSPYCTDVALMVQAPIFHVNGDDPEAVVHAARIATEFRQLFHKDVVIDMICYRRFGHNESDEPAFTQPLMYREIKDHPTTLSLYSKKLVDENTLGEAELAAMQADFIKRLDEEFNASKSHLPNRADWLDGRWAGMATAPKNSDRRHHRRQFRCAEKVGKALTTAPSGFHLHKTLARILEAKAKMFETGEEALTGQPPRPWPSARCLMKAWMCACPAKIPRAAPSASAMPPWWIRKMKPAICRLTMCAKARASSKWSTRCFPKKRCWALNMAILPPIPKSLGLVESSFGDFANGAQVVIDQFTTASGEMKWLRMSGLVLLLPHGYEGQGPEHSSARLERYLQLCAQDNMQVVVPTTPANYFHLLRRQMHRPFRKPLIVMTPKSLLRHKKCISFLTDMGPSNSFHRVLRDQAEVVPGATTVTLVPDDKIQRVVLCSGKVYFDLMEEREKRNESRIQILRLEQLYPFPENVLAQELNRFPKAEFVWCQEEPKNQGAWNFVKPRIEETVARLGGKASPRYVGRPEYASTAAGLMKQHLAELAAFLNEALTV